MTELLRTALFAEPLEKALERIARSEMRAFLFIVIGGVRPSR